MTMRLFVFVFLWLALFPVQVQSGLLGDFSLQNELELGKKITVQINRRFTLIYDPVITSYAQDIVDRLASHLPPQPFPFRVQVIVNPGLNAFAIAAGNVYIFTGLLLNAQHEAEIASVFAHEMGHVVHRHIAQNIERGSVASLAAMLGLLAGAIVGGDGGSALAIGSLAGAKSSMLHYSRENEREADQAGFNLLLKAGYPPEAMVQIFEKMRKLSWLGENSFPAYLSTHPGLDERIGTISSRINQLEQEGKKQPYNDKTFLRIQALVRARYADPDKALVHFQGIPQPGDMEILATGIVLSRLNRIQDAQPFFSRALEMKPDDSLFLREAGRFLFEYKDAQTQALDLLSRAVQLNADDFLARFFLARVRAEKGDHLQAIEEMKRVLREVPYDWEVHSYLGRYYGARKEYFHAHLHLASSFFYREKEDKAHFHLQEARKRAKSDNEKKAIEDCLSAWEMWKGI